MKPILITILIFTLSLYSVFSQPFMVGHTQRTYVDSTRSNRDVTAEIYYPADSAGDNVAISPGQFPVLIFGHGFIMTWSAYQYLWEALIPQGYIMVFATTETSILPSHADFGKDLAFLNKAIKEENNNATSLFYNAVTTKSAVMGHSMGGGCAYLAVQYDSTLTAIATLAAAETNPSAASAANNILIPSIVFSGANDCVAPAGQHQQLINDSLASYCKSFISIIGASHCQFADNNLNCSLGELFCSPSAAISRGDQHEIILDFLKPWLKFYLKNDCSSGSEFQDSILLSNGITSQQNCALTCTGISNSGSNSSVLIYPNPAKDFLTIENNNPCSITIFNQFGEIIKYLDQSNKREIIDVTPFSSGIYYFRVIKNNGFLETHKISIIK